MNYSKKKYILDTFNIFKTCPKPKKYFKTNKKVQTCKNILRVKKQDNKSVNLENMTCRLKH